MKRLWFQHVLLGFGGLLILTTLGLAQNVTDPCSSYDLLDERARNTNFSDRVPCGPQGTKGGWYRFDADGVGEVVTECPNGNECGVGARVWINGTLPSDTDNTVSLPACLTSSPSCCPRSLHVAVKNCGGYFVYNIGSLPPCALVCLKIPDTTLATSSTSTTTQTTTTTPTTTPSPTTTSTPTTTPSPTTTSTPTTTPSPTTTSTTTTSTPTTTTTLTTTISTTQSTTTQLPTTTTTATTSTSMTTTTTRITTTPTTTSKTTSATTTTSDPTTNVTPSVSTDPCIAYTNLTDGFSMVDETNTSRPVIGQHPHGWYRMPNTSTGRLATECPLSNQCGSGNAIWLKDPPDETSNLIVRIQLCLKTNTRCCEREVSSRQKLCPGFVVYDLPPSMPDSTFCYNNSIPITDSTTQQVSTATSPKTTVTSSKKPVTSFKTTTGTSSKKPVTSFKTTVVVSTTASSPPDESASKFLSTKVIAAIGGSAALIVGFIIVLIIVHCCRKRKSSRIPRVDKYWIQ